MKNSPNEMTLAVSLLKRLSLIIDAFPIVAIDEESAFGVRLGQLVAHFILVVVWTIIERQGELTRFATGSDDRWTIALLQGSSRVASFWTSKSSAEKKD